MSRNSWCKDYQHGSLPLQALQKMKLRKTRRSPWHANSILKQRSVVENIIIHPVACWRFSSRTLKSCTAANWYLKVCKRNRPRHRYYGSQFRINHNLDHNCLTFGCVCSDLAAACVEGSTSLQIFKISDQKRLQKLSELVIPGAILPNSLAFDSEGNLWAVSGCDGQIPFQISVIPASYFGDQNFMHSSSQNQNSTASPTDSHSWDTNRLRQICSVEMCEALQVEFAPENNNNSTSGHATDSQARLPGAQVGSNAPDCDWAFWGLYTTFAPIIYSRDSSHHSWQFSKSESVSLYCCPQNNRWSSIRAHEWKNESVSE